ncbi:MAG TPA: GLUG motif-containing protein, partial [Candidatus Cloacimonadota bacterium]|nr:GLUG motif-containing protein [Candidatus Cloacimonadota bacterium]
NAEIKNLGLRNVNISGRALTGSLAGCNKGGIISSCFSKGSVSGTEHLVGGLIGYNESGTISNCYNSANVNGTGYQNTGGLVGCNYDEGLIVNCYNTGNVNGTNYNTGGLVGDNWGTIQNAYYNYETVLINNTHVITTGALNNEMYQDWFPTKSLNINHYLSSNGSNYLINNLEDFKCLLAFGQSSEYSYELMNPLDLSADNNFYIPYFSGIFNGNGFTVSNLLLDLPSKSSSALFGYIKNASIQNLGLVNVNVNGYRNGGALAGIINSGNISNCYSNGIVNGIYSTGGLVGNNQNGTISDCYSVVNITGEYYTGGLLGYNTNGSITNCYSNGILNGLDYNGGLVGYNYNSTISDSYSTLSVNGNLLNAGLVAYNYSGLISYCYSSGDVNGEDFSGGLVGENRTGGTISKCYSTGNCTAIYRSGGLVCENSGSISHCYNRGNVSGGSDTGGLLGGNSGTVSNCYNTGTVSGSAYYIGGLIGRSFSGNTANCYWDIETSGQPNSDGGIGKTTAEMKTMYTYVSGWSFPVIWNINPEINDGYPYLNYPNSVPADDIVMVSSNNVKIVLHSAYPNPFNPSTTISFDLASTSDVKIDIYNIKGQLVRHLVNKMYDKGFYSVVWDGSDTNGHSCGTGVYFYKMTAGHTQQIKKMMMMK